jgi:hypothetical protein
MLATNTVLAPPLISRSFSEEVGGVNVNTARISLFWER